MRPILLLLIVVGIALLGVTRDQSVASWLILLSVTGVAFLLGIRYKE